MLEFLKFVEIREFCEFLKLICMCMCIAFFSVSFMHCVCVRVRMIYYVLLYGLWA